MKNQRVQDGFTIQDPATLHNLEHNPAAGAKKVMEVGAHLTPIMIVTAGVISYVTVINTAAVAIGKTGACLMVYNNSASLGSITLGEDDTTTSLAAGVTDASGHVGIACKPNDWTKISCGTQNWAISSAATLLVYLVEDQTSIKPESK